MALANSSFPVPVSPDINTVDLAILSRGIIPVVWRKHLLVPINVLSQLCIRFPPEVFLTPTTRDSCPDGLGATPCSTRSVHRRIGHRHRSGDSSLVGICLSSS